jgi:hypothetical protein
MVGNSRVRLGEQGGALETQGKQAPPLQRKEHRRFEAQRKQECRCYAFKG